jgi:hypothetical protein
LFGKHGRNRPLGTPWGRWEDNIKMHLLEIFGSIGLDESGSG